MSNLKANRRARIKKRIRKNISGTTTKPRKAGKTAAK